MQDFISDDHDHSHSITSLSVQLFTVPTLAQYLMAHHQALVVLVRCFLNEIERRKNYGKILGTLHRIPSDLLRRTRRHLSVMIDKLEMATQFIGHVSCKIMISRALGIFL